MHGNPQGGTFAPPHRGIAVPYLRFLPALLAVPILGGCAAAKAFDVATAPVRAASTAINTTGDVYDRLTVSDSERDQKRGRQIRQREERLGKLDRQYRKAQDKCRRGNDDACEEAGQLRYQIEELSPQVPYEPD